jgi:hypothetical protein
MPKLKVIDAQELPAPAGALPNKSPNNSTKRSPDLNLDALHALVVAFGPREAARQSRIPAGTVLKIAARYNWQQNPKSVPPGKPGRKPKGFAIVKQSQLLSKSPSESICHQSPGNALNDALTSFKGKSMIGLAQYSAKAATALNKVRDPLKVTRKAVDIADVHKTIWPAETNTSNILQIGLLIQS